MTPVFLFLAVAAECLTVDHARLRISDLARALPAFQAVASDAEIGYAPQPGARRVIPQAEVVRLARQYSVPVEDLSAVCFGAATSPVDPDSLATAMRASFPGEAVRIEVVDYPKAPVAQGEMVFPLTGLAKPRANSDTVVWNGYVRSAWGQVPVWAKVRILQLEPRLVAAVDLVPGQPIGAGQVKVEVREVFPGEQSRSPLPEDVLGSVPRHLIASGQPVRLPDLNRPCMVCRGDEVRVEVRSGAALLRFDAKAESQGFRGDLVALRNPESGKVFRSRVTGPRSAVLECDTQGHQPEERKQ